MFFVPYGRSEAVAQVFAFSRHDFDSVLREQDISAPDTVQYFFLYASPDVVPAVCIQFVDDGSFQFGDVPFGDIESFIDNVWDKIV